MRKFVIEEALLIALMGFLGKQEYKKVAQLIQELSKLPEVKIQEVEK